ncbi:MAG: hypothetical protein RIG67_24565 [Rhodospirillales bacterium]
MHFYEIFNSVPRQTWRLALALALVMTPVASHVPAALAAEANIVLSEDSDGPDLGVVSLSGVNSVIQGSSSQCWQTDNKGNTVADPKCQAFYQFELLKALDGAPGEKPGSKGHALCGGVDNKGKLQPACRDVAAKPEGKPLRSCATDEFRGDRACWKCPAGFERSARDSSGDKACRKGSLSSKVFAPAVRMRELGCPGSQKFRAVNGGSCWSCPATYKMVVGNPLKKKICQAQELGWKPPAFAEPGLFGIKGGPDIALDLLRNPQLVTDLMVATAKMTGVKDLRGYVTQEWTTIRDNPNASVTLTGMAWMKLLDMLSPQRKAPLSQLESALLLSFADYVRARRSFVAQDAIDMYDNWKAAEDLRGKQYISSGAALMDLGSPPPNFQAQAMQNLAPGAVGSAALVTAIAGFSSGKVLTALVPYVGAKTTQAATGLVGWVTTTVTVGSSSSVASVIAAAAGPVGAILILATGSAQVAAKVIKSERARPILEGKLRDAQKLPNLTKMAGSDKGMQELNVYWIAMVSGGYPKYTTAQKQAFAAAYAAGAKTKF